MSLPRIPRNRCLNCGKEPARPGYKYCSNGCQQKYQSNIYVNKWKKGELSGLQVSGIVTTYVKRYLREKYGDEWGQDKLINVKDAISRNPFSPPEIQKGKCKFCDTIFKEKYDPIV